LIKLTSGFDAREWRIDGAPELIAKPRWSATFFANTPAQMSPKRSYGQGVPSRLLPMRRKYSPGIIAGRKARFIPHIGKNRPCGTR